MGNWKFIRPAVTTNLVLNPQFDNNITDGWTSTNGTHTRVTTYQYVGPASYRIRGAVGVNAYTRSDNISLGDGESMTCTVRMYRAASISASMTIWDSTNAQTRATDAASATGEWELLEATWTNNTGGAVNIQLTVINSQQAASDIFFDAAQAERKTFRTTYCSGTQEGCTWNGEPHNSTSTRSAMSRAGGRIYDFADDYSFHVVDWQGWGVPPHLLNLDSYAILPGAQVNSIKTEVSTLTLVGYFDGGTMSGLHALRQALVEELAHDRYPKTAEGWQPIRIRYTGATVTKEAKCFYDSGLEGSSIRGRGFTEEMPVRFLMADPFWYEVGESATTLDTNDTATLRYVTGRLRSTGQWDDLGLTNNPGGGGTIRAITYNPHDGLVYFGGNFTNFNQTGTGIDYIVAYDPVADTWSRVGGANDVNGVVWAIAIAPNGDVYIGGDFTNVDGDADADYLAYYDISAGSWEPVASGGTEGVLALAFDHDGLLYIGGDFTAWNAVDDYIVSWNGAAYAAVGTGVDATVLALVVGPDNTLYAGGAFDDASGTTAYYVASWDGSSWSAMGDGFSALVNALAIHPQSGELYATGAFNTNHATTETYNHIARWTGAEWRSLGDGLENTGKDLSFGPDGVLYVCGDFITAGDIAGIEGLARWTGDAWANADCVLPGAWDVYAVEACRQDSVVTTNYDIYIGFTDTGSGYFAGDATATNDGTAAQYPQIVINRSGGTSATLTSIRNETTGKTLYCYYGLLDGETLTIDCRPGKKSITSDMFGERPDAILANSDFGSFALQSGANTITAFVDVAGAPTVTAYLLWKDAYRGMD